MCVDDGERQTLSHALTLFLPQGDTKYISFTPDRGGWNNIRMSMEIIFVIAAASGRTLVLPPEQPLYLLHVSRFFGGSAPPLFYFLGIRNLMLSRVERHSLEG